MVNYIYSWVAEMRPSIQSIQVLVLVSTFEKYLYLDPSTFLKMQKYLYLDPSTFEKYLKFQVLFKYISSTFQTFYRYFDVKIRSYVLKG